VTQRGPFFWEAEPSTRDYLEPLPNCLHVATSRALAGCLRVLGPIAVALGEQERFWSSTCGIASLWKAARTCRFGIVTLPVCGGAAGSCTVDAKPPGPRGVDG